MSNEQAAPETKGVTVKLLATVDLGPEIEGMKTPRSPLTLLSSEAMIELVSGRPWRAASSFTGDSRAGAARDTAVLRRVRIADSCSPGSG